MSKIFKIDIKKFNWVLFSIILVSIFLRLYHLDYQSAWLDEIHTLKEADPQLSFQDFHREIMFREGIPHFYFLMVNAFSTILGHSIYSVRLVSAVFGVLSVLIMYLIGKEIKSKELGYIAASITAIHPFLITHSQDGRSYSMFFFFAILSNYFLIRFIKSSSWKDAILLGISAGLITNAHPIGLLNVASIYFFLLIFLIIFSKDRWLDFKKIFISGILFLAVFSPVYMIVTKVSEIKSFWIPQPNLTYIVDTFKSLLGEYNLFVYGLFISFIVYIIINLIKYKSLYFDKKIFLLLMVWFFTYIGVILLKSYFGVSIILDRYFIGVLPVFILTFSYVFSSIQYKYFKYGLVSIVLLLTLHHLIFKKNYYNNISKTQWDKVAGYIVKNNISNDKIYSAYGWLMQYYLNASNNQFITEITFEKYVDAVKDNFLNKESFWYMDGNFRPYSLNAAQEKFLSDNYIMDHKIELHDSWARHYIYKNAKIMNETELKLNNFTPSHIDENGNILIFENGTITSSRFYIKKGNYNLIINANSFPETPINNENAHIKIQLNEKEIANYYVSEKKEDKEKTITINNNLDQWSVLKITYDNDYYNKPMDRNLLIYEIKILKK